MISKENIAWIGLEMTGLNPEADHIIQIAALVTNSMLAAYDGGIEVTINQPISTLEKSNQVVQEMHKNSGLFDKALQSSISISQAEKIIITYIKQYCVKGSTLLGGNSIWVDRIFIKKHLPHLDAFFHYRMIDVSTIKELAPRWYPNQKTFKKQKNHTALADIHESILELKYYKDHYFIHI